MYPTTIEKWTNAADERARDTESLLKYRPNSVGAVYMAGYIVEINIKALWACKGKTPPYTHNLRNLWVGIGGQLSDLQDRHGMKTFFFDKWNPSLRYETKLTSGFSADALVKAAKSLAGIIRQRVRRERWSKRL